jgi:hypothetical protein
MTPPPLLAVVVTLGFATEEVPRPPIPLYCINCIDFSGFAKFYFGAKFYLGCIINWT